MNKNFPYCNYENYRPSRNPYFKIMKDFSEKCARPTGFVDENTEQNRGRWREYFQKPHNAFLQLELGTYHGETLIDLATRAPDQAFLGIEWKFKQCYKAAKKARDRGLENICFLRANMSRLPWVVAPGEVDRVWVLFPDPWSSASHQKHRVLHPGFVRILGALLHEGKELMIKTDHKEYGEYIQNSVAEAGCFSPMDKERAASLWSTLKPTPFEKIFARQGASFYSFAYVRNSLKVEPPEEVREIIPS